MVVCFARLRPIWMDSLRHNHTASSLIKGILKFFLVIGLIGSLHCSHGESASDPYGVWDATLTAPTPTPFSAIEPYEAFYEVGWEGLAAGGVDVKIFASRDRKKRRITARGGPSELIRKLWDYHADYYGEAGANGEVPSWFHIDERIAKKKLLSDATFTPDAVFACHHFTDEVKPWVFTPLPGVRDLFAAMLLIRSQPLQNGDHIRLTIFPDRNPYLVDLTVAGRDTQTIIGKKIPSIRFTIRIRTIELFGDHRGQLAPHRKFRSGRVWISDDNRRLPLRAEVDVFVGSVYCELTSVAPGL